ncbi:hypothetical protein PPYR_00571 [Photinus pyralis]|uniref:Uncharacterized protein n=1 Tax=Photinus pyralis TaxID=7054 RepID=A0A5N4B1W3_PHOPY|nr:hypothetical protein PPYR_00571 [Photinus pyralis]
MCLNKGNELCTSKITDVRDVGDMLVVNIRDTKTNVDRTFTIVNNDRKIRGEHVAPIINLHNCENCIINVNIAK